MIKMTFEFGSAEQAASFLSAVSDYQNSTPREVLPGDGDGTLKNSDPEVETPAAEEVPKKRRRGRPAKKEEDKPAGRRRAAAPAKEEAPAVSAEGDTKDEVEISDAEVSKAASEAAKDLGVQNVLDELAKFQVAKVSELDQPQRRKFVAILRDLLNPSDEGAADPAFN